MPTVFTAYIPESNVYRVHHSPTGASVDVACHEVARRVDPVGAMRAFGGGVNYCSREAFKAAEELAGEYLVKMAHCLPETTKGVPC